MGYVIASLPPTVADAPRLLVLVRGRWQVENGLHYVKDVTLGEDRSLINRGKWAEHAGDPARHGGQRAVSGGVAHSGERLPYYGGHPEEALAFLGIPARKNE